MMLRAKDQELALAAALRWMTEPTIVRRGPQRIVVGRDLDDPRRWTALCLHEVDTQDRVWWTGHAVGFRTRSAAVEAAHNS